MQTAHLSALNARHAACDERINEETRRPQPDPFLIASLKKEKLKLKQQIATG